MNLNIEKITNGYLVTIDGKKTFYDVPEAICGATAEWVLAECKRLESAPDPNEVQHRMAQMAKLSKLYNDQLPPQWVNYTGE
jgi:hypothetical protein